eukprot:CAMPEP_0203686026 /NCGR_PEP_ID=MMETSP0090-20130426/48849_1 /ASSEMBLY_ACC=CAM_ASM_001088 /TAXON_ID=426623 /ORGANISM="Chaetoceros affinis, Strain CCMP159" /LENGTH=423 /DNA_ID=CAMNT_0050555241 /DNA_START=57 /DNA_END=1329 /DNA_ORIENTATION=+
MSASPPHSPNRSGLLSDVEKIFGDERDLIASRLITEGGSKPLVIENLKVRRRRYTHDPVGYSASTNEPFQEAPFVSTPLDRYRKKVSIVGCGQVGLAVAFSILNKEICNSLVLVDVNGERLEGEVLDFQQASAFAKRCTVEGSTNFDVTRDSNLVIVTAGAKQKPGQSRLDLLDTNTKILKSIVSQVLKYSPSSPICIVSNPCDVMAAVASKIAKDLPPGQIFGSGTVLDTGRFRQLIASSLNLDIRSVTGYVIGEHGDSSLAVWSSVQNGGVKLLPPGNEQEIENARDSSLAVWSSVQNGGVKLLPPGNEPGDLENAIHSEVVNAAGVVIAKKGYTNWAVGMACAEIAEVVLGDLRLVLPVSTCVRGYAGVAEDVFLSVPCVVGSKGVIRVFDLELTASETALFKKSASTVWDAQKEVWDRM